MNKEEIIKKENICNNSFKRDMWIILLVFIWVISFHPASAQTNQNLTEGEVSSTGCSDITYAENIDRGKCVYLLEIKDAVYVPDSVAEPLVEQCALFQNEVKKIIKTICKIDDTDARKVAADKFNYLYKDDYNIYIQMIRVLREYLERKCLGTKATVMCNDVVKANSEIDAWFTIFRSRRPLPEAQG